LTNSPAKTTPPRGRKRSPYTAITVGLFVVLAAVATAAILLAVKWPFTQAKIVARLESGTSAKFRIRSFRTKYFPPGCVIEGVELRSQDGLNSAPLMTVGKLTIVSNYRQLLLHQGIEVMHLEDVHLDMGQGKGLKLSGRGGGRRGFDNSSSINEIVVDRGAIEYPRKERSPLTFNVHQLRLDNVVQGKRISFHLSIDNPLPPGQVRADGQFDPWSVSDIRQTPLSGVYRFTDVKLSSLGGIAGTLSSQGSFGGPANALRVQGSTDTPNYELKSAGHPLHLRTDFQAVVDCTNGDVGLQSIQGRFEKTAFGVTGDVTGKKNARSKVASLQATDPGGRIEDWLRLFTSDQIPAMAGAISFQTHITISGGPKPFIQRVHLTGDFGITEVTFTKPKTQQNVSELSLRAQGQKVPDPKNAEWPKITGELSGHVELIDGVAHFSELSYKVPGATADAHGTYSFDDKRIDLHGQLRVDRRFSMTASGPKGLLTRVTEGLFAKGKGKGEILPVKLTGTYDDPSYGLDK
jgi:AsmA-like C-terminal region